MKLNSRTMMCGVLAVAFAVMATYAGYTTRSDNVETYASEESVTPGKAGILAAMTLEKEDIQEHATIEEIERNIVTSSGDENLPQQENSEETSVDTKEETTSEWSNKLMADVRDSLNIRKGKNTNSKIVGVLLKGSGAKILERDGNWVKIQSGDVTGYVKASYCAFGEEAEALANKLGTTYVIVQTDGLRVRKTASATAEVMTVLESGHKLKVRTSAKEKEGWVAVTCQGQKAYVSKEYVTVKLVVGKAITEKKYQQMLKQSDSGSTSVSSSEVTLLAAIIQCEAGGESYQGQVAVGAVVMNRVSSSTFPNTIAGVIYQQGQFCPVRSGVLAHQLSAGVSDSCLRAAKEAISGVDNVNGALYFQVSSSGRSGTIIGHHVFY